MPSSTTTPTATNAPPSHPEDGHTEAPTRRTLRTPALVAGIATLLLAATSAWAVFGVLGSLVTAGDAARTAQDIVASESTFRLGILALAVTAALDVAVAWALRAFFAPVHRGWSTTAAWLRTIYAGIFGIAITQLVAAITALPNATTAITGSQATQALRHIEAYHLIWDIGLVLFGLHLVAVGYLAHRARYVPRLVGPLVVLAGLGYVFDGTVAALAPGTLPEVAPITFVGEVVLLLWFLIKGRTVTVTAAMPTTSTSTSTSTSASTNTSTNTSTRRTALFLGLMFLTATATFTTGDALVVDALGPGAGTNSTGSLTLGVALQAINAIAVAAIGAGFVRVLRGSYSGLAFGHFAIRVLECLVIIGIGAYMLVAETLVNYEPIIYVFTGTAGLMFTYALLRAGLVPAWLARLGLVGYVAILAVLPVELLNLASLDTLPGMLLYVPGGLYELILPLLLIARGFRHPNAPVVARADEPGFAVA